MIGHYLLSLCPEAEHDVLTGKMLPVNYARHDARCLVGWAADISNVSVAASRLRHYRSATRGNVDFLYDELCARFGTERINAGIRNRILTNQARRTLKDVPVAAHV